MMPTTMHVSGLSRDFKGPLTIEPGTSLGAFVEKLGGKVRLTYEPPPPPLIDIARRAKEVGDEVSKLLRECETWADVPAPHWEHGQGECVTCDARRIVADMLEDD